ncbi:MAG: hypothetical protein H7A51_12445 [Akkermansiaceae bacterium]|nr:hypothetical protein [Akkermansiaceae bacterium]
MKPNLKLLAVCPFLLGLTPLIAQEAPFDPLGKEAEAHLPRQVRIQVEYIEMSLEQMTELMDDPTVNTSDIALRKRIGELTKTQKATIIETQMLIARSGEKATAESVREFIYPTEYEPAELPHTVKIENGAEDKITKKDLATGPTPTAFETRNLGSTLEVEPVIDTDNKVLDVRISPELVYHVENLVWSEWKDHHGEANIMMPVFYTLRVTTAASVVTGKPCLLAALSPRDDKGVTDTSRKILVFLKADIMYAGR